MKSPFPGMDPYLEVHWADVHSSLVHNAAIAIQEQLTGPLRARVGERWAAVGEFDPVRSIYPGVQLFQHGVRGQAVASRASGIALAEPLVVRLGSDEVRQTFVRIIDVSSEGSLVSTIEFLSPSNKLPGDAQKKYRQKQREAVDEDTNLVEIDLTRGGEREFVYPVVNLPRDYQTTYLACAYRGVGCGKCEFYRMPLNERLPGIRIPLRKGDPDAALDLQALVDRAYANGRYDDIDYRRACIPPLEGEDAAWVDGLLKAAGKR